MLKNQLINNLRYADDTPLMADSGEELKSLLMKVKEESEKAGLKLIIQKTKITASSPITSWQIDGCRTWQKMRTGKAVHCWAVNTGLWGKLSLGDGFCSPHRETPPSKTKFQIHPQRPLSISTIADQAWRGIHPGCFTLFVPRQNLYTLQTAVWEKKKQIK